MPEPKPQKKNQNPDQDFKDYVVGGLNIFTAPARSTRQSLRNMYDAKYARRYAWAKLWFSIAVALMVVAVLLFATTILSWARSPLPRILTISMRAEKPLRTADMANLAITITNRSREVVQDARLVVEPPKNFILEGDHEIKIGTLARESRQTIIIKGLFIGSEKTPMTLIATVRGK